MFGADLKGIIFFLKTGQRSPAFQVIVELGGRVTGSGKRVGERQTRPGSKTEKVKRVQRGLFIVLVTPGSAVAGLRELTMIRRARAGAEGRAV